MKRILLLALIVVALSGTIAWADGPPNCYPGASGSDVPKCYPPQGLGV